MEIAIPIDGATLGGNLTVPADAKGLVLFVHGSGSSRHSPRNQFVARMLHEAGLGTLLFDLLTSGEEQEDLSTRQHRFDIHLLAERLARATEWVKAQDALKQLSLGYFGSSTGAAAALVAAAERPEGVGAVVSRGGRPDLAGNALPRVRAATLLIVGGDDEAVIAFNQQARQAMSCEVALEIVPGATHLFEETGALDQVARLAGAWFAQHLGARAAVIG